VPSLKHSDLRDYAYTATTTDSSGVVSWAFATAGIVTPPAGGSTNSTQATAGPAPGQEPTVPVEALDRDAYSQDNFQKIIQHTDASQQPATSSSSRAQACNACRRQRYRCGRQTPDYRRKSAAVSRRHSPSPYDTTAAAAAARVGDTRHPVPKELATTLTSGHWTVRARQTTGRSGKTQPRSNTA
jgi:hypothetical protein